MLVTGPKKFSPVHLRVGEGGWTSISSQHPATYSGTIDNSALVTNNQEWVELKEGLRENVDFIVAPCQVLCCFVALLVLPFRHSIMQPMPTAVHFS